MGAAESKSHGSSAVNGSERSSKAKLTFMPGADPLLSTPIYTLRDAFYGKRPVSAFTFDPSQFAVDNKQEFLPKAIKKVKTIRHPSVLKFIDCKSSPAGVHLITEQVRPLTTDYLESISEDEILLGLYDILVNIDRSNTANKSLGTSMMYNG
ncbi:Protein-associating with the carboxyl-terminal domain of ezrin, partial [Lunasporangiospora selenospora]